MPSAYARRGRFPIRLRRRGLEFVDSVLPRLRRNRKTASLHPTGGGEPSTESSCGVGATNDDNSTRAVVAAPIRSKLCVRRKPTAFNPTFTYSPFTSRATPRSDASVPRSAPPFDRSFRGLRPCDAPESHGSRPAC